MGALTLSHLMRWNGFLSSLIPNLISKLVNLSNSESQRAKAREQAESPESQLQIAIEQKIVNQGTDKDESLKAARENDKNKKYPYFMYSLALI